MIQLLGSQYWVAHIRQLAVIGVSRQSVAIAVGRGTLERLLTGIVGIPGHWNTFEGRCMAALLAAGPGSLLSGTTAARLYGLRRMPEHPVKVMVEETHHVALPPWATLARTSWADDEPRPHRSDELQMVSPLRMLFDLASTLPDARFAHAAEDAWHLGLLTPTTAGDFLARVRRRGRSGVARFERWLDVVSATQQERPAESGLEQLLADLARRAGLPDPVRQHRLTLPGGRIISLDLAWPSTRFAIEPGHSWWHGGDDAQRRDQERDRLCTAVGWQVVRYDETVWSKIDATVREIAAMYRSRTRDVS